MLKTTGLYVLAPRAFVAKDEVVKSGGGGADKTIKNLSTSKKSKNDKSRDLTYIPIIGVMREHIFLTPNAKEAFNRLRQAFIEALILWHFDLKSQIRIKTDVSGYAIGGVLS